MGLLFRPRRPVMRLAADVAGLPSGGDERERSLADRLVRAVHASMSGDVTHLSDLFTDDVCGSSPTLTVASLAELADELADRRRTFSEVEIDAEADVTDDQGFAEWVVTGRHTGPLVVDESIVIPPSGQRVTFRGVTVSEFRGDKISSYRQYWDELEFLQGLGLIPRATEGTSA